MIPLKVIWKTALHRELLSKISLPNGFVPFVVRVKICLNE